MPKRIIHKTAKAARWWWELPPWIKWGKMVLIMMLVLSLPAANALQSWRLYHSIYDEYYAHFYASYSKGPARKQAHFLSDYYADFYASYYSDANFRYTMRFALPSASAKTTSFPTASIIAHLHTSPEGLQLIQSFEGLRLKPYYDSGGKLTIGYGHLIKPGEYFTEMTEKQAAALLKQDVKVAEAYLKRYVTVKLTSQQFSALTSLVYNIGPEHFRQSTLLYNLNRGNIRRAANEILRWEYVGSNRQQGLTRRRIAEKALFES